MPPLHLIPRALVLLAALAGPTSAQTEERSVERGLAERYVQLLAQGRTDELEGLLAPDAVFDDPTAAALAGTPRHIEGRDAILGFFKGTNTGTSATTVDFARVFVRGEHVALSLRYRTRGDAGLIGAENETVTSEVSAFTVLRIEDGRVAHQTDYIDYGSILRQFTERDDGSAERKRIAHAYLDQLFGDEIDAAATTLATAATYRAPLAGDGATARGAAEVAAALRRAYAERDAYATDGVFTSGPFVVLSILATPADAEGGRAIPATVVLRIEDERVVEHVEYFAR